jgi:hypothetical protein
MNSTVIFVTNVSDSNFMNLASGPQLEAKCTINSDALGSVTRFWVQSTHGTKFRESVAAKTATVGIPRKRYGVVMVLKC